MWIKCRYTDRGKKREKSVRCIDALKAYYAVTSYNGCSCCSITAILVVTVHRLSCNPDLLT